MMPVFIAVNAAIKQDVIRRFLHYGFVTGNLSTTLISR